jgi:hypothetical protein
MCRFIDEKVPGLIPELWVTVMGHLLKRLDIARCNKGDFMFFTQGKLLVNFDAAQSTNTYEK